MVAFGDRIESEFLSEKYRLTKKITPMQLFVHRG